MSINFKNNIHIAVDIAGCTPACLVVGGLEYIYAVAKLVQAIAKIIFYTKEIKQWENNAKSYRLKVEQYELISSEKMASITAAQGREYEESARLEVQKKQFQARLEPLHQQAPNEQTLESALMLADEYKDQVVVKTQQLEAHCEQNKFYMTVLLEELDEEQESLEADLQKLEAEYDRIEQHYKEIDKLLRESLKHQLLGIIRATLIGGFAIAAYDLYSYQRAEKAKQISLA